MDLVGVWITYEVRISKNVHAGCGKLCEMHTLCMLRIRTFDPKRLQSCKHGKNPCDGRIMWRVIYNTIRPAHRNGDAFSWLDWGHRMRPLEWKINNPFRRRNGGEEKSTPLLFICITRETRARNRSIIHSSCTIFSSLARRNTTRKKNIRLRTFLSWVLIWVSSNSEIISEIKN